MTSIKQAMIMAAGLSTRMRPLTDNIPKPMIKVAGKTLIEFTIGKLLEVGVTKIVINLHYKAELLKEFIINLALVKDIEIIFSYEKEILEAGGTVKVLHHFEDKPFYVLNSDNIWFEQGEKALTKLAKFFDAEKMDLLLLMQHKTLAIGHDGGGDFNIDEEGRVYYLGPAGKHDYIFIGPRIVSPKLFASQPVAKFHLFKDFLYKNRLNDNGILDRVYGIEHKGYWLDIGNLAGLKLAEEFILKHELVV